ncbi:hypothetical protein AB0M36_08345 [Actinoplanes sp. NPDC051346]|uniref:hypothetical protein n=1 Tax=Actinoplanes sp. NPDC051346 TaxID=3155048 RepID=UPI00341C0E43
MTLPGLRGTPVRHTVIVAVGLVTGQALLCAVIGFLTFDGRGDAPSARSRVAAPLLDPPIVVMSTLPAPVDSSRVPSRHVGAQLSRSARPVRSATPGPSRATTAPAPPTTTVAAPVPSTAPGSLPPTVPEDRRPKRPEVGAPCEEEGLTGESGDGRELRCEWDRYGHLRWRTVDRRRP